MTNKHVWTDKEFGKMVEKIHQDYEYLVVKATPLAFKYAFDEITAKARTKTIRYLARTIKVPQWAIRRKLPKKLQRKANINNFLRKGKMASKSHILTDGIPLVSLLGTSKKGPTVSKLEKLYNSDTGIKVGAHYVADGFVADGEKRIKIGSRKYNEYIKKQGGSDPVLKGRNAQVMRRKGKSAYQVEVVKVPMKNAGRALDSFTTREARVSLQTTLDKRLDFVLKNKVRF